MGWLTRRPLAFPGPHRAARCVGRRRTSAAADHAPGGPGAGPEGRRHRDGLRRRGGRHDPARPGLRRTQPANRLRTGGSTYHRDDRTHDRPSLGLAPPALDEFAGRIGQSGVLVSNTAQELRHPDLGPNSYWVEWVMRDLPPDGIVLAIQRIEGGLRMPGKPDSSFPLTRPTKAMPPRMGEPKELWRPFRFEGRSLTLRLWFGSEVSAEDQAILDRIIESIRPTRIERSHADTSDEPATVEYATPLFMYREGWHTRNFGFVRAAMRRSPGPPRSRSNRMIASIRLPRYPPATIAALPPDGMVVTVLTTPWSFDPDSGPYPAAADRRWTSGRRPCGDPRLRSRRGPTRSSRSSPATCSCACTSASRIPRRDRVALAQQELEALEIRPSVRCPPPQGSGRRRARPRALPATRSPSKDRCPPAPGRIGTIHRQQFHDAWWNASPDEWEYLSPFSSTKPSPANAGPLLALGEDGRGACAFSITFSVPDVPPGVYPIVVLQETGDSSTIGSHLHLHRALRSSDPPLVDGTSIVQRWARRSELPVQLVGVARPQVPGEVALRAVVDGLADEVHPRPRPLSSAHTKTSHRDARPCVAEHAAEPDHLVAVVDPDDAAASVMSRSTVSRGRPFAQYDS